MSLHKRAKGKWARRHALINAGLLCGGIAAIVVAVYLMSLVIQVVLP